MLVSLRILWNLIAIGDFICIIVCIVGNYEFEKSFLIVVFNYVIVLLVRLVYRLLLVMATFR